MKILNDSIGISRWVHFFLRWLAQNKIVQCLRRRYILLILRAVAAHRGLKCASFYWQLFWMRATLRIDQCFTNQTLHMLKIRNHHFFSLRKLI